MSLQTAERGIGEQPRAAVGMPSTARFDDRRRRPLRIGILAETYAPVIGGGETQTRLLAEGLAASAHQVTVITRRSSSELPRRELRSGVDVVRVPPAGVGQMKKWMMVPGAMVSLLKLLRDLDVIFVAGFRILGAPAVVLGRLMGVPCVLKAESDGEMSGDFFAAGLAPLGLSPRSTLVRAVLALRNRILRTASLHVAMSEHLDDELREHGVPATRIHRIPNCVDAAAFHPPEAGEREALRARLGIAPHEIVVVYTGRLVTYKGLPVLLRAWRTIAREHLHARLILVGAGGLDMHDCESTLREYVRRHGLEQCVRFAGEVDCVARYLGAADVFVFPTEREAFGLALVEALACGLPAVVARTGELPGIVAHDREALLVEPGSEEELRAALADLLSDESRRARLSVAAAETGRRYGSELVIGEYEELFRRAAAGVSERLRGAET